MTNILNSARISVVIPCRNEVGYLPQCLDSILCNDYPRNLIEILVVDGSSSDGTREVIAKYSSINSNVILLDNHRRTTPCAFNIGIKNATGEYVLIMNAHCTYPKTYVSDTVSLLLSSDAANAGGRVINVPNGTGNWAIPVAFVTGHRFGVGNSSFRLGGSGRCYVDTVAHGLYRKGLFDEVGFFDERLTRNQDNEFNSRLLKYGKKIICDPSIHIYYSNQPSVTGLIRQGYFTGMWNMYTLVLYSYTFSVRRLVPAAFVLYLFSLPVAAFFPGGSYYLLPLLAYLILNLLASLSNSYSLQARSRIGLTFLLYHIAYGLGTLRGAVNVLTRNWNEHLGQPLVK